MGIVTNMDFFDSYCDLFGNNMARYKVIQMTNQEAIDLLDNLIGMIEDNHGSDYDSAIRMAIDALTEPEIIIGGDSDE